MFPSAFETSVYTVQATVCPKDTMVNPLSYRQCTPAVPPGFDSRTFAEELHSFCNLPPVQNCDVTQPHPIKGASGVKENTGYRRKRKQEKRQVQFTDSEVRQQPAAKRRRKTEALFFCTVPDCSADFTTKHRLESHIKGYHLGVKDNICGSCSYATAHRSDLRRHLRLKHA